IQHQREALHVFHDKAGITLASRLANECQRIVEMSFCSLEIVQFTIDLAQRDVRIEQCFRARLKMFSGELLHMFESFRGLTQATLNETQESYSDLCPHLKDHVLRLAVGRQRLSKYLFNFSGVAMQTGKTDS